MKRECQSAGGKEEEDAEGDMKQEPKTGAGAPSRGRTHSPGAPAPSNVPALTLQRRWGPRN